ncbi:MAG: AbrB/MazE/SpoVT family DNA-binding domain-containing protein [Ruminococcaceae bacterium]|nr:AbrB/MazE/SpoVT family DNA-binding domain-containing protein [Oscillospiraceae bacterium]
MKATGIVRRIDDLGRVVIPKEIRRTMRIREGDPLEIFTDREGEVIFKKYSPIGELNAFAEQYAQSLSKTCGLNVVITDRDSVIASAGVPKKDYQDKRISKEAEEIIESRTLYICEDEKGHFNPCDDVSDGFYTSVAMPIITEGDITGCIYSLCKEDESCELDIETEKKLIQTAASFLSKQLES